jgi:hypothetical protein
MVVSTPTAIDNDDDDNGITDTRTTAMSTTSFGYHHDGCLCDSRTDNIFIFFII